VAFAWDTPNKLGVKRQSLAVRHPDWTGIINYRFAPAQARSSDDCIATPVPVFGTSLLEHRPIWFTTRASSGRHCEHGFLAGKNIDMVTKDQLMGFGKFGIE
jgi:hypothetical protein